MYATIHVDISCMHAYMCAYVPVYAEICVHIFICVHTCMYVLYIYRSVHISICVCRLRAYIGMHLCIFVNMCQGKSVCVCIFLSPLAGCRSNLRKVFAVYVC